MEVTKNRRRPLDVKNEINANEEEDVKRLRGVAGVDIGDKLVSMISQVDEDVSGTMEDKLVELVDNLHANLEPYEGTIIHILAECAMYLPEKLTNFTTIIGLMNAKTANFGENMIAKLISLINEMLVNEEYDIVLRLTTFLTDLGNCNVLTAQSIFEFLDDFVNLAVEENVRSDYFVYVVLHSLPWIGAELAEKKPQQLDELLDKIGAYLGKRTKQHLKMLQVWSATQPHIQEDSLDCLWAQIEKLRHDNWMEHHIVRIYAAFSATLKAAIAHNLPSVDPQVIVTNKNMPLPMVVFRLFDPSDCLENEQPLPPANTVDRFLVEEDLNWILDNNYLDWRLCAKTLVNYHRRAAVPLEYCIVEVIFGQLFRLPRAPHIELFYGTLLLELCHLRPGAVPQVLAQATELLYQRIDAMQPICMDRFVNWFSFHLSNFQYRWSWNDWVDCVELDTLCPRLMFVREVVEKCMRFSYHKRLSEFLPAEMDALIPPEPVIIDVCAELGNSEMYELSRQLQSLIEARRPEQVYELLKSTNEPSGFNADAVAVFTAVLLKLASKTFSHSFSALTKYHKIFRAIVDDNEEMQSVILRTLYDCWNQNKQMMTILVDKMLKMQIVDPSVVQAWVFCDEMKREFKRFWVWEVLDVAINRLELHLAKLVRDAQYLQKRIEKLRAKTINNNAGSFTAGGAGDNPVESVQMADETAERHAVRSRILPPNSDPVGTAVPNDPEQMDAEVNDVSEKENLLNELESKAADSQANIDEVEDNLRNVLLSICHKFTVILTEHLLNCETEGTEIETDFFNYVIGRFRHIFLSHTESMWKFNADLDKELFSSSTVGPRISEIFKEFRALKI